MSIFRLIIIIIYTYTTLVLPSILLNVLSILTYLILMITLPGRYYYYPVFTDEKNGAEIVK